LQSSSHFLNSEPSLGADQIAGNPWRPQGRWRGKARQAFRSWRRDERDLGLSPLLLNRITAVHAAAYGEAAMQEISENALEQRARRAARRAGLVAKKTRWRLGSIDNYGWFMLIDPSTSFCLAGERFDMTPQDVIDYCQS
jgi:hypothetical protein